MGVGVLVCNVWVLMFGYVEVLGVQCVGVGVGVQCAGVGVGVQCVGVGVGVQCVGVGVGVCVSR